MLHSIEATPRHDDMAAEAADTTGTPPYRTRRCVECKEFIYIGDPADPFIAACGRCGCNVCQDCMEVHQNNCRPRADVAGHEGLVGALCEESGRHKDDGGGELIPPEIQQKVAEYMNYKGIGRWSTTAKIYYSQGVGKIIDVSDGSMKDMTWNGIQAAPLLYKREKAYKRYWGQIIGRARKLVVNMLRKKKVLLPERSEAEVDGAAQKLRWASPLAELKKAVIMKNEIEQKAKGRVNEKLTAAEEMEARAWNHAIHILMGNGTNLEAVTGTLWQAGEEEDEETATSKRLSNVLRYNRAQQGLAEEEYVTVRQLMRMNRFKDLEPEVLIGIAERSWSSKWRQYRFDVVRDDNDVLDTEIKHNYVNTPRQEMWRSDRSRDFVGNWGYNEEWATRAKEYLWAAFQNGETGETPAEMFQNIFERAGKGLPMGSYRGKICKDGDWVCLSCGYYNFRHRTKCMKCEKTGPGVDVGGQGGYKGKGGRSWYENDKGKGDGYKSARPRDLQGRGLWDEDPWQKQSADPWAVQEGAVEKDEPDTSTQGSSELVWACPKCRTLNYADRQKCRRCTKEEQWQGEKETAWAAERSEEGWWSGASGLSDKNREGVPADVPKAAARGMEMRQYIGHAAEAQQWNGHGSVVLREEGGGVKVGQVWDGTMVMVRDVNEDGDVLIQAFDNADVTGWARWWNLQISDAAKRYEAKRGTKGKAQQWKGGEEWWASAWWCDQEGEWKENNEQIPQGGSGLPVADGSGTQDGSKAPCGPWPKEERDWKTPRKEQRELEEPPADYASIEDGPFRGYTPRAEKGKAQGKGAKAEEESRPAESAGGVEQKGGKGQMNQSPEDTQGKVEEISGKGGCSAPPQDAATEADTIENGGKEEARQTAGAASPAAAVPEQVERYECEVCDTKVAVYTCRDAPCGSEKPPTKLCLFCVGEHIMWVHRKGQDSPRAPQQDWAPGPKGGDGGGDEPSAGGGQMPGAGLEEQRGDVQKGDGGEEKGGKTRERRT